MSAGVLNDPGAHPFSGTLVRLLWLRQAKAEAALRGVSLKQP